MAKLVKVFVVLLTLTTGVSRAQQEADTNRNKNEVFMWSSTGGGWRAMVACMGFANLFGRAGLIPLPSSDSDNNPSISSTTMATTTSRSAGGGGNNKKYFDSISTTSGASWFSTQFFYSYNFYAHTMTDRLLPRLIEDWFVAYKDIALEIEQDDLHCLLPSDLPDWENSEFEKVLQLCDAMMHYNNEWAAFVTAMLNHSATKGYEDAQFGQLQATPDNRIMPLQNTKLLLHTTMVPQTRTFHSELLGLIDEDYVSNLGPATGDDTNLKYAGVLPVTYSVDHHHNATAGIFTIGSGAPLQIHQSKTKRLFHEDDWKDYGLFPLGPQDQYLISTDSDSKLLGELDPTQFFGGSPLTTQVASISSAAAGGLSPSAPSVFAQVISHEKYMFRSKLLDEVAADLAVQGLYDSDTVKGTAVCSQWPQLPCNASDARFIDGAYSDNPAFIQNIAHYQQQQSDDDSDLSQTTLKIVLTNTNQQATTIDQAASGAMEFVKYWKNPDNANVTPGVGYLWTINNPYGSPQIFEEELTLEEYANATVTIPNSNITTRLLKGTTVDNPLWRIRAGQSVEILLISINSPIPIMIVGSSEAQDYTQPLVDMATELATSSVLLERVQAFFSSNTNLTNIDYDEGSEDEESEEEELLGQVTVEPLAESSIATTAVATTTSWISSAAIILLQVTLW